MRVRMKIIKIILYILLFIMINNSIYMTYAISLRYDDYEEGSALIVQETDKMIQITAQGAILMDAKTGAILYNKNVNKNFYPASVTKIMTALVVIENASMEEIVTYSDNAINNLDPDSSLAGFNVGAQLTVKDSLYGLLLSSGNDAAAGLAEHIAGTQDKFAEMMTTKAKEIGCLHTTFKNPHGLFDENHKTTPYDMALILRYAMQYDIFREIMKTITYNINKSETLTSDLELWNHSNIMRTNSSWYYMFAEGSKTGYIEKAGNTLASYAKKGDMELICVVLKDEGTQIYEDTIKLFEYGFDNFEMQNALKDYNLLENINSMQQVPKTKIEKINNLELIYNTKYLVMDRKNTKYDCKFYFNDDIESGILGYIKIMANDKDVANIDVTYNLSTKQSEDYIKQYKNVDTNFKSIKAILINKKGINNMLYIIEFVAIIILTIILIKSMFVIKDIIIVLTIKNTKNGGKKK